LEALFDANFRLRNDLYCVEWGVKLYSLTHCAIQIEYYYYFYYYYQYVAQDVCLRMADFPCPASDLWFTGYHFVGKLSSLSQPTRPTQPSIPLGLVN